MAGIALTHWRPPLVVMVTAIGVLSVAGCGGSRGTTTAAAVPANGSSRNPEISADGRFVTFESEASNLIPGDTNGAAETFVRDQVRRTTELAGASNTGAQPGCSASGESCRRSADGRFVAFERLSNLPIGDANDVFVRNRATGTTERVNVSSTGTAANGDSDLPALSADGRFVAFTSLASNLVAGDTNRTTDVFVRDRLRRTTERVSVSSTGAQANLGSGSSVISADGRYVAFESDAWTLGADPQEDAVGDIFVRDRVRGTTELVSVSSAFEKLGEDHGEQPAISADGRFVAFTWWSLRDGATGETGDVFVRDRVAGTTELVSVGRAGPPGQ